MLKDQPTDRQIMTHIRMNFRTENNPDGIFTGEIDEIFRKEDGTIARNLILNHLDWVEKACLEQKQAIERLRQDPDWEKSMFKQVQDLVSLDLETFERFVTAAQRMTKMESLVFEKNQSYDELQKFKH